ncbi:N-methyl-L-tryptophan oxidase, partial [Algoriphagus mannitolivorans]|uniref:N-methyl-L-tryptophan oxidase n=1 Tax=Algoriphagus mannitolivorans TaxID=226504 RepID=UPI00041C27F3
MGNPKKFDFTVIGLGAVGSAAFYQLSKSGKSVLGIDRFNPPHEMGSSHGETRITRLAVGEGEDYVALAKRSHEIWKELEAKSGKQIMSTCGGILIDSGEDPWSKHGSEGFWERTVRFAQKQEISHEILTPEEAKDFYPAFNIPEKGKIYREKEAGFLRPELAISTQIQLACSLGAKLQTNCPVLKIEETVGGFCLKTTEGEFWSERILISSGGWVKDFLPSKDRQRFKICRQILHWVKVDPELGDWSQYPVWMWGFGPKPEDFIYGFPSLDGKTVKMATESFLDCGHPDALARTVSLEEQKLFWDTKVKGKIKGLLPEFLKSKVCFYTVTEDARFVVENWNGSSKAQLVSACSGHGFKHSAALGEKLALQLLE